MAEGDCRFLAAFEDGRGEPRLEPVVVRGAADEDLDAMVRDLARSLWAGKDAAVLVFCAGDLPPAVFGAFDWPRALTLALPPEGIP